MSTNLFSETAAPPLAAGEPRGLIAALIGTGKDAFHRVLDFARNDWDAVERVLTGSKPRGITFGARRFVGLEGHARHFTTTNKSTKESK
jgi:hypothetical protein